MSLYFLVHLLRWLNCLSVRGKCTAFAIAAVSCLGLVWAKARGGGSSSSCDEDNVTKGPEPAYLEIKYNYVNYLLFVSFAALAGGVLLLLFTIHLCRTRRKLDNVRDIARGAPMPMMWSTVLLEADAATLMEGCGKPIGEKQH